MTSAFSVQAPGAVVMVRPRCFASNPDTVQDNAFQSAMAALPAEALSAAAYAEVTTMAHRLEAAGVKVHLFEDNASATPDSVFPNNWFSTHAGGHVAIYPMYASNRRKERRADIIEQLKQAYRVQDVIDYSGLEQDQVYLEGTGAMVLDHVGRVAYVARSRRADPLALERFCTHFNFEPVVFDAADSAGRAVYHTNVLMCVGTDFALAGLEMIGNAVRRAEVRERLAENGRTVLALSASQVAEFAGNAMELQGSRHRVLALSSRAVRALTPGQLATIERSTDILALDVPTIELAGGSVRCMLAGIHLTARPVAPAAQAPTLRQAALTAD
ncbi:MAG: arginine deiminase-related protein [Polaromonas sp.]